MRPVEARERLHRLDAGKDLVHVHRVQQGLVVAGLELVGADEEPVGILPDTFGDPARGKSVQRRLAHLRAAELVLAREGHDGLVPALALRQVVADGVEVLDRALDPGGDHHRPRFSADLVLRQNLLVEVVHHDLGLEADRVVVTLDIAAQLLLRLVDVELRVVLDRLGELVVARHRRVVREHVQDEAFLDRLLHGVAVEGAVPDRAVGLRVRRAEDLQRLVLGRGREGEVARVGEQLARLHQPVDPVLEGLLVLHSAGLGERLRHRRAGAPALAGVRLVDDDGEAPPALLVADLVEDEGELLHRRDDDLLAGLDEAAQVARAVGMAHRRADLGVLADGGVDLPVENPPVGDHDDGIEDLGAVLREPDQLMRQPGDGVALAAARRVLDQVASSHAVRAGVGEKPAHDVELVIAGPDLGPRLPTRLLVP